MDEKAAVDYYELLQISTTAEPDTIHRVYRLLAQRFHPDNGETGSESRFKAITEAYHVLSDPERRARYDLVHENQRRDRWRLVSQGADADNDYALEQRVRLTILEVLYTRRRLEPHAPGTYITDIEKMVGRTREQLEFSVWYLVQKKLITRSDNSLLVITAEGVDQLEANHQASQARRLRAVNE